MNVDEITPERTMLGPLVEPGRIGFRTQRLERASDLTLFRHLCDEATGAGSVTPTSRITRDGEDAVDLPPFEQERRGHL